MNGLAVVSLAVLAASCGKETDMYNPNAAGEQAAAAYQESFSEKVGGINENQTWETVGSVEAEITVNAGFADKYTVAVYDNNPLYGQAASMLAIGEVAEGGKATIRFAAPLAQTNFVVGVFDAKGHAVAQNAVASNGKFTANIGTKAAAQSKRFKASESDYTGTYAKTLNDFLNPTIETCAQFLATYDQYNYAYTSGLLDVVDRTLSVASMREYTVLTNNGILTATNTNRNLSDGISWEGEVVVEWGCHGDGKHYYVPKGTEITEFFNINSTYAKVNESVIYIEGKVHLKGNTLNGVTLVVGEGGEIIIDSNTSMSNAGRFVVMAGGKITATSNVVFNVNNGMPCYNAGEIDTKGELNINGSNFYNCGTVKADVLRNTSGGLITNFGTIEVRTNKDAADAYNCTFVNGCYIHYKENAGIGNITMLRNSRLDVDGRAQFNNSTSGVNHLEAYSEINCGALYVNATEFFGPENTSDFAIIKTGKIDRADIWYLNQDKNNAQNIYMGDQYDEDSKQNRPVYAYTPNKLEGYGTIYLDWNPDELYMADGTTKIQSTGNGSSAWWVVKASEYNYVREASAPAAISIPAGDCTGTGYNDNDEEVVIPIPETPVHYSIAFEDLGSIGDFDFNDIVLYVDHYVKTGKATAKIMAAGGILDVDVKYDGVVILSKNDGQMTNTTTKGNVIATIENLSMSNPVADLKKFALVVKKDGGQSVEITSGTQTGKAPMALIIPNEWAWPKEQVSIVDAYPAFKTWAKENNNTAWYENPVEEKVVR